MKKYRQAATITLTTDFGLSDEYAGVVKGVVYCRAPNTHIVDLTHTIPAYDIKKAAYLIAAAYAYFPPGSIHVVVVDPGVGGERDIILLEAGSHFFLAPDNGVLTLIIQKHPDCRAFKVANSALFLKSPSATFHGRDIFAPVAAHLANGAKPPTAGPEISIEQLTVLPLPQPVIDPSYKHIAGTIISIDHFGNCVTNIHKNSLTSISPEGNVDKLSLVINNTTLHSLEKTYQNTPAGEALALFNSRNYLEIAVNRGNAAQILLIRPGDSVLLHMQS